MTRTWKLRLLVPGALALALGCRSAPPPPPCQIPLMPEEVIQKPAAATAPGTIQPPAPFARLPENKQPDVRLPDSSPDQPAVRPPADVAPLLSGQPGPAPREVLPPGTVPTVKPLLVDAPKPPPGPDGFAPAPKIGLPEQPPPAAGARPPARDPREGLPLRAGQRFGHAADYKWVAGILDRHQKGGYWTIRYAPSGDDDPWGGKVRLLDGERLSGLGSGDVVYIEGELLAPRSAADTAAYPPYRVTDVRLLEKAK